MEKIRVKFVDFWTDLNKPEGNYFYELLSQRYIVEFSDDPEIVFYSCYGKEYLKYKCLRIFYSPENHRPDFTGCDYAITFDYNQDSRHLRFPLWTLYYLGYLKWFQVEPLETQLPDEELLKRWKQKSKFCCFIVSNPKSRKRVSFFRKLDKIKRVDSAGRHLNNIGYNLKGGTIEKLKFIRDYKFVISFENTSYAGYTTEKILEPLLAGCIPIYWGNPLVDKEFNTGRFINYFDFVTEEELIGYLMKVDQDDNLALKMLKAGCFTESHTPVSRMEQDLYEFLLKIVESRHEQRLVAANKAVSLEHAIRVRTNTFVAKLKHYVKIGS